MRDGEDVCFWCRAVKGEVHDANMHPGPPNVRDADCQICGANPTEQHDMEKHRNTRWVRADYLYVLSENGFPEDTPAQ